MLLEENRIGNVQTALLPNKETKVLFKIVTVGTPLVKKGETAQFKIWKGLKEIRDTLKNYKDTKDDLFYIFYIYKRIIIE